MIDTIRAKIREQPWFAERVKRHKPTCECGKFDQCPVCAKSLDEIMAVHKNFPNQ